MSDRRSEPGGDPEVDAELERRLRAAFRAATAPETPTAVHAEVARLAAALDVRTRPGLAGWLSRGWLAVVLAVSILVLGSLLSGGSSPAPTMPSPPPGPSASTDPSQAAPSSSPAAACDVSPGTIHGTWWREIGGPNAFFNWEEGPVPAGNAPWKVFVRFDPDASLTEELLVWAYNLKAGVRAEATLNGRVDPSTISRFDQPAPELPGGLYLFEQPLPSPGCWYLSAAVDGQLVGSAVIEVGPPSSPSAPPTSAPTPAIEPTPAPVATLKPSSDDVLPLAGRDGLPGSLYCGPYMPFPFEALSAPTGAEDRAGPEFDLLRSTAGTDPDPGGDFGPDPTFREVVRDANAVLFLYQLPADTIEDFRYLYIRLERQGIDWGWAGSGDCTPRAVAPPGYGQATWTLDPAFRVPDSETRTLHILVQELACSSGRSASGRISPAFVTWDERHFDIEVFVEAIPEGGDCQANPPTPATLRLPVPVGNRILVDAATLDQGGTGG